MNRRFIKSVYDHLKTHYTGISKDSWIWKSYFSNEDLGFNLLKKQMENDEEFFYLTKIDFNSCENYEELVSDVAFEITGILNALDLMYQFAQ